MKTVSFIILISLFLGCQNSSTLSKNIVAQNSPEENAKAKTLFTVCQRCHGEKAELHALTKSDIIAYYSRDDIMQALTSYQKGQRDRHRFGYLMKGIVSDLSPYEINILANYISKLKD